jgi:hypothetical protein
MRLKPTAGCQISTLIFGFGGGGVGTLCISHDKLLKDGKVLCHLGIRSKVLPGPLTDISGIMHLNPTAGCQISTLIFGCFLGGLCISHEKLQKDGKVLCHLGLRSKVLPGPLTDIST